MYINGINPNIEAFYPPVCYPVSRGTHAIHSIFSWDHEETWTLKSEVQGVSIIMCILNSLFFETLLFKCIHRAQYANMIINIMMTTVLT